MKIDTQGPVVTPTNLAADALSGWTNGSPQTVSLAAADAGSGVKQIQYTVDGVGPTTYSAPFTVSGTGSHVIVYTATDQLGNVTQKTGYVNISNPYAQATNLAADATSGWHDATTGVTITGTGDHTPITVYYSTDSGTTWTTASSNPTTVTFSAQGSHPVWFYAQNSVGVKSRRTPKRVTATST